MHVFKMLINYIFSQNELESLKTKLEKVEKERGYLKHENERLDARVSIEKIIIYCHHHHHRKYSYYFHIIYESYRM